MSQNSPDFLLPIHTRRYPIRTYEIDYRNDPIFF